MMADDGSAHRRSCLLPRATLGARISFKRQPLLHAVTSTKN